MEVPEHEPGCRCCRPPKTLSRRSLLTKGALVGAAAVAIPRFLPGGHRAAGAHTDDGRAPSSLSEVLGNVARPTAARRVPAPAIVPRSGWGANESLRHGTASYVDRVDKIVVHHTGTHNGISDWAGQVRQIYEFETSSGYNDIAYHFLIDPNGIIYEGRWARDLRPGETPDATDGPGRVVVGGHAIDHNLRTIGIALIGDYTQVLPSAKMLSSLVSLLAWQCGRLGIDPMGVTPYVNAQGRAEWLPNVCPHGATTLTQCPGTFVLAALPNARRDAAIRLAEPMARGGYWIVAPDGSQYAYGAVPTVQRGGARPTAPIVGIAAHQSGSGVWTCASDGGVFAYGDAPFRGSAAGASRAPIVGMAPSASGRGYWLAASDGGVFAFGDARFHGSLGKQARAPLTSIAPSRRGYLLAASDGGVFAFGDARFEGSAIGASLPAPVVSIAPTVTGRGYVLLTADGSVVPRGDAPYLGGPQGLVSSVCGVAGPIEPRR